MKDYLIISTSLELLRVPMSDIIYISSDGNYSSIVLANGETRMVTMQLGQIEVLLSSQAHSNDVKFVRVGRGFIINCEYVFFINLTKQQLVLSDGRLATHTLTASKDALRNIKLMFENDKK